jgi:hypothetical protein
MFGNSQTFKQSRKGQDIWIPLFDQLQANGLLYDGLPVRCEQHPQRKAVLREINHFEKLCPDGGRQQACGTKLNCGLHDCPQSVTSYLTIPRCSAARLLSGLVVEITKLHDHAFSNKIYALAATKKTKKPNGDGSEIWNSMLRGRLN